MSSSTPDPWRVAPTEARPGRGGPGRGGGRRDQPCQRPKSSSPTCFGSPTFKQAPHPNESSQLGADTADRYPDITSTFARHLRPGVRAAVFDCEAVAFNRETQKILPFQILSTRKKKDVSAEEVKVQACCGPLRIALA